MSTATREQMEAIHAALVKKLGEYLDTTERPSAAMLSQIRRLLADNGIVAPKSGMRSALRKLEDAVPFNN